MPTQAQAMVLKLYQPIVFDTTPIDVTADTVSDIVSTNDADISSGDITSSEYARKGGELMKLANDLRAMGYAVLLLPLLVI